MKKKTKGIIMFVFFGGIMMTSGVVIGIPGILPHDSPSVMTVTGTPMDNYPDVQRTQFCSSEESAKSSAFVKEYKIPTQCTQPLAIVTDPDGNIWFTQTNTGRVAKFDPINEVFTEYNNTKWQKGTRSMMWGIDYSSDGSLWFTDEATDGIWKFSILEKQYGRTNYPKIADSLPQRLSVEGSKIIVNDFTGNKLTFLDPTQSSEGISYLSIPSPVENSVTGAFAVDSQRNIWYTNWVFQNGGVLAKFNQDKFEKSSTAQFGNSTTPLFDLISVYQFPKGMTTPNGIAAGTNGKIWIADTSSSFFFSFDPNTESFTKYSTSPPQVSSYGNFSGVIKNPVSRPYWATFNENGKLVFNEQTANRIGVFDPESESLVEYMIPSHNPNWADCEEIENCGLSQIFDFTNSGDKIWFTEWVENNIGVIDTSLPVFFDVELDSQKVTLKKGEKIQLTLSIIPNSSSISNISITSSDTAGFSDLIVEHNAPDTFKPDSDIPRIVQVSISASENALPDVHKVLIGAQTDDLVVSKFVTVIIEQ
ncbi:MAG: virginiamycin B lyase family protein [Nitrosopumilaceae archaeon]